MNQDRNPKWGNLYVTQLLAQHVSEADTEQDSQRVRYPFASDERRWDSRICLRQVKSKCKTSQALKARSIFNDHRPRRLANRVKIMFKTVRKRVWAFDAEWIPDPVAGRLLYNLPDELPNVEVLMFLSV